MDPGDVIFLSAVEQARLIRDRVISPLELVDAYLHRIEELDPTLNAFVSCTGDDAMGSARTIEASITRRRDLPRFAGVPIAIKDNTDTAGIGTTLSSKVFSDRVPEEDASVVRRLKGAGFVVLGKTNMPEFGTVPVTESDLNGVCRNPWDPGRTPGGSSGGAAAAVAAGMVGVAQGTDGGGSIRIPAACCGVFGLKPSRGRISIAPSGELWSGFSTPGPITRYVVDAAALLDVMTGYETGDPYWLAPPRRPFEREAEDDPMPLRVAFTTTAPDGSSPDPAVAAAVDDAARLLASLGHEVENATPDWFDPDASTDFVKVALASSAAYYGVRAFERLEPINRMLAELAEQTSALDLIAALESLRAFARRVVAFFNSYDVLLIPAVALPPVPTGWLFEESEPWEQLRRSGAFAPFTPVANVTGQPAMSVPLFWNDDGVPIGVQMVGRPAEEATLLSLAGQLERARSWTDRLPPVS